MKKVLAMVLTLIMTVVTLNVFTGCAGKSDEELIEERIEAFVEAYNDGDMDGMLENFEPKTRNMMKGTIGIGESLLGEFTGVDLSMSDMFGLSAGILGDDDLLEIEDIDITDLDRDSAEVTVEFEFDTDIDDMEAVNQEMEFDMVKDGRRWYISMDMDGLF